MVVCNDGIATTAIIKTLFIRSMNKQTTKQQARVHSHRFHFPEATTSYWRCINRNSYNRQNCGHFCRLFDGFAITRVFNDDKAISSHTQLYLYLYYLLHTFCGFSCVEGTTERLLLQCVTYHLSGHLRY